MKAEKPVLLKSLSELKCLTSGVKPTQPKPIGTTVPKPERVVVALADAGRDDWSRFKRECVLLKGGKR